MCNSVISKAPLEAKLCGRHWLFHLSMHIFQSPDLLINSSKQLSTNHLSIYQSLSPSPGKYKKNNSITSEATDFGRGTVISASTLCSGHHCTMCATGFWLPLPMHELSTGTPSYLHKTKQTNLLYSMCENTDYLNLRSCSLLYSGLLRLKT